MLRYIFIMAMFAVGCNNTISSDTDESVDQIRAHEDEYIYNLARSIMTENAFSDPVLMENLVAEIETLNDEEIDLFIDYIDEIADQLEMSSYISRAGIPVYWDWWSSGYGPSYVGTTSSCGGDIDVMTKHTIAGAYNNPGNLWFETSDPVVYAAGRYHGGFDAYRIYSSNIVYTCIGVKGSASVTKAFFWALMINI